MRKVILVRLLRPSRSVFAGRCGTRKYQCPNLASKGRGEAGGSGERRRGLCQCDHFHPKGQLVIRNGESFFIARANQKSAAWHSAARVCPQIRYLHVWAHMYPREAHIPLSLNSSTMRGLTESPALVASEATLSPSRIDT
jgi:hypothetical protein